MAVIPVIIKMVACSGLLYGYYHLFLRNRRFHRYNRFFLLASVFIALVLPFLHIPVYSLWGGQPQGTVIRTLRVISAGSWEEPVTIYASRSGWSKWLTVQNGLLLVYLAGLITGLFFLVRSLAWIQTLTKKYPAESIDRLRIFYTNEPGTPFSFFRNIFWDNNIPLQEQRGQQIFRHEMFHVKEKHSADVLFMEIICCCSWFNPFFHLVKKELKAIHEFLADEYAASANNRYEYAELLVAHAITQKKLALATPFFHNQLKRRITMITESNLIRRSGYISRIMALPLVFLLVSSFAVKLSSNISGGSKLNRANKPIRVVIDPGHGGKFPGARGTSTIEKDLTLAIAKKISELSPAYNIHTVLTRSTDELVAGASDLKEDLENRVAIANNAKADVFISLHANATPPNATTRSGFEVYIGQKTDNGKDRQLSSALIESLKTIYTTDEMIKESMTGVHVLDRNNYPCTLIECGYITNPKDEAYVSDPVNQEKIARKILEGIVKYGSAQQTSTVFVVDEPAGDTLSAAEVSKLNTADLSSMDADVQTNIVTIHFKNGDTKYAHASDLKKFYADHNIADTIPSGHKPGDDKPTFTRVEQEADYPGGEQGWIKFLLSHLKYPDKAVKKNIQGTVVMQFIVNTDGTVSDIEAISGPEELKKASIDVIKQSGKWIPAKQNGKTVRAYKKQPITYKLS